MTSAASLLLLSSLALAADKPYFPPPDSKGGWRTLEDPAAISKMAGMDTARLDQAFDYVQQTSQHGGLLIVRHGYLVYEKYFGRGNREALPELASCGKAFTSVAVGIMLKEKHDLIPDGLDQKVFTPKYMPAEIFPLDDPRKADITLGQLLAMSSGIRGINPAYVKGEKQTWDSSASDNGPYSTTDGYALHQSLWCAPGDCYSYATTSPHLASIVLRRLTGMEMEAYMRLKMTEPLGFGTWGYAMYRPKLKGGIDSEGRMEHTPGGGSNAVRSTDMLRFAYLLLMRHGQWGDKQIVPADFVAMCGRIVKYNPHYTHSFNFNVNEDLPREGCSPRRLLESGVWRLQHLRCALSRHVIYKMGGTESQYDPKLTRLPVLYKYDGSRDNWKPGDPKVIGDSTNRTLEMVVAAVTK